MQQLGFLVVFHHLPEFFAAFFLQFGISKIGSSDWVIQHSALLLSFLSQALRFFVLVLVEVLELAIYWDIFSDFFIVLNCLNFVTNQLLLNISQLLLVHCAIILPIHTFSIRLLSHLKLQFTFHLSTLLVKSQCFLSFLMSPLLIIFLNSLVPLIVGHSDHFTLITLNDLCVNVNIEWTGSLTLRTRSQTFLGFLIDLARGFSNLGRSLSTSTLSRYTDTNLFIKFIEVPFSYGCLLLDDFGDFFLDSAVQVTFLTNVDIVSIAEFVN